MAEETKNQIRVKFVYRGQNSISQRTWLRQFPGNNPIWGNCRFIFDRNEQNYDWLVVKDDLPPLPEQRKKAAAEPLACPPEHTLFITREPSSVSAYSSLFLNQFRYVLTGQEDWAIRHPGKIHSQPALRWFYGDTSRTNPDAVLDYDHMAAHPPENKTKVISTVCSAKRQKHTQHNLRVEFIEKLQQHIPELERFGKGVREMEDKAEALDSFKYHIAIENHICPHWWTEKLSDSFMGLTLPFYFGTPNASDYFPPESFIPIDIRDFEGSLKTITDAIQNNEYEKRLPAIREARKLAMEKYSTFAVLSELIEARNCPNAQPVAGQVLCGKYTLRNNPLNAVRIGIEKLNIRRLSAQHKSDW